MRYLVLLDANEDQSFGRHWHIVDAHDPASAVTQIAPATGLDRETGESALAIELDKPITVVRPEVRWEAHHQEGGG